MSINLIMAVNEEGALGYKNQLLYHLDLKHFKNLTTYNEYGVKNYILFGRKSYESLPKKPLPNRTNIVVTHKEGYKVDDSHVIVCNSLEKTINHYLSGRQEKTLWICGGQNIYEQSIKFADKVYLTMIHDKGKKFDVQFNLELLNDFYIEDKEERYSEEYQCTYDYIIYKRKENAVDKK